MKTTLTSILLAAGFFVAPHPSAFAEPPASSPSASAAPPVASPAAARADTPPPPAPADPPLNILGASYSFGSHYADVTARVRALLRSEDMFQANPGSLHTDPQPGWNKVLVIFCDVRGQRAMFSVGEGENVSRQLIIDRAKLVAGESPAPVAAAPVHANPSPARFDEGLWLGDPEMNQAEARARAFVHGGVLQQLALSTSLGEYDRVGKHDPRWDADAREALRLYAPPPRTDQAQIDANSTACTMAFQRAVDDGCDDPLVVYLGLRRQCYAGSPGKDEIPRLYTRNEKDLLASGYSTMRKFFACVRTLQADFVRRHNPDGTVGRLGPGTTTPAKSWPSGIDVKASFQHGLSQLLILLHGTDLPPGMYADGVDDFLEVASTDPIGRAEVLEPLEKLFDGDELKEATYPAKLIEGQFWTNYAWDARGGGWASTVTGDGWKLFGERLVKARAALETAWKLDPGYEEVPYTMLAVVLGQGCDRAEVDRWFRRAMDARPDAYFSGTSKLLCLEPKWGGSAEEMIAFGRECLSTHDWFSQLPLILYEAHDRLAKQSNDVAAYWKQPDVWADMRDLFSAYLDAIPTDQRNRTSYAVCAYRAEEWKVAHEQFEILGDNPSAQQLEKDRCSFAQYQKMRHEASEHVAKAP